MNNFDVHGFSADRPIQSISDDLLGRSKFAIDIADALAGWHANDSLVVALHGNWGSGKSSIKNMALSELKKLEKPRLDVIEFSPWEWAAQEKINASFFSQISIAIGKKDKSKEGKKLALTLKKYGRYLVTGEMLINGFSSALPTLFVLAAMLGLGSSLVDDEIAKNILTTLLLVTVAWGGALKWGGSLLNQLGLNWDEATKENEQSLADLRIELSGLLSQRDRPLLIVMDDLDRLTSEQLRMVIQLVKANTEFPNVVFLLLFQRDIVEAKLAEGSQSGREFLEKIIQVPFDIPKIENTKLTKLLFSEIDKILLRDKSALQMFDNGYWGNIFYGSLVHYFDNPRSIYRFASTLSFHFSLFRGKKAFEVNPVDLIAVEAIRVFEPDVYAEIARAKSFLTKNSSHSGTTERERITAEVKNITSKSSTGKKKYIEQLISSLFPSVEWVFGGPHYSDNSAWLRDMRIGHPTHFDKYFQFSLSEDELSNSDLQKMIELTADTESFKEFVATLKERGMLKTALEQFEAFVEKIPVENAIPLIQAILDIGDEVDHQAVGFAFFSSHTHLVRTVVYFLRRIQSREERANIISECFSKSTGFSVVEHLLMGDESRRTKGDSDQIFNDEGFSSLKNHFINKITQIAKDSPDNLLKNSHLASLLYRWERWGSLDDVRSWIKSQIVDTEKCIRFLKSFVRQSSSQSMGDYVAKISRYIRLQELEHFVSIDEISEVVNRMGGHPLNGTDQEAVNAFKEAILRRSKGEDEDDW